MRVSIHNWILTSRTGKGRLSVCGGRGVYAWCTCRCVNVWCVYEKGSYLEFKYMYCILILTVSVNCHMKWSHGFILGA